MSTAPIFQDIKISTAPIYQDIKSKFKESDMDKYNSLINDYNVVKNSALTAEDIINNDLVTDPDLNKKIVDIQSTLINLLTHIKNTNRELLELTSFSDSISSFINYINETEEKFRSISIKIDRFNEKGISSVFLCEKEILYSKEYYEYIESSKLLINRSCLESLISSKISIDNNISQKLLLSSKINNSISTYKNMINSCSENTKLNIPEFMCSICCDNKISNCLNPCGHTFCTGCINKMTSRCFICSSIYKDKVQIFISGLEDPPQLDLLSSLNNSNTSPEQTPYYGTHNLPSSGGSILGINNTPSSGGSTLGSGGSILGVNNTRPFYVQPYNDNFLSRTTF